MTDMTPKRAAARYQANAGPPGRCYVAPVRPVEAPKVEPRPLALERIDIVILAALAGSWGLVVWAVLQ